MSIIRCIIKSNPTYAGNEYAGNIAELKYYAIAEEGLRVPRPRKCRNVCCLPVRNQYGPLNTQVNYDIYTVMNIDEYETIRLIDLEGFTQEECARHMNIARTTVQGIYNDARKKLADSLVNGKVLRIEGGDYKLCEGLENYCNCGGCHRHRFARDMENGS